MSAAPGPWGPTIEGGRRHRGLLRVATGVGTLALIGLVAIATTTQLLVQQVETNLSRVPVPELEQVDRRSDARAFLLVGSDAREGLDAGDRADMSLGAFEGQRADVVIYVALDADREQLSLVSFPRDLLVDDDGVDRKLTETFAGGPDQLIRVFHDEFDLPVHHYGAVTLGGFVEVVRTLGTVEICLEQPLRDRRAGADFDAGCHDMDGADALAYVRSRQGARADLERIDRQQRFIRAVLQELTQTRTLTNPRQVYRLTEDVASAVTTDDQLGLTQMLALADEARQVVGAGLPMTAVPSYPLRLDGIDYMVAYGPGASALFDDLRAGRPIESRGSRDERDETTVAVVGPAHPNGAGIVDATLRFAGFSTVIGGVHGTPPADTTTTVYEVPGQGEAARWVAATLGAPVQALPAEVTPPDKVTVVVAVGEDATG